MVLDAEMKEKERTTPNISAMDRLMLNQARCHFQRIFENWMWHYVVFVCVCAHRLTKLSSKSAALGSSSLNSLRFSYRFNFILNEIGEFMWILCACALGRQNKLNRKIYSTIGRQSQTHTMLNERENEMEKQQRLKQYWFLVNQVV